ncbi:4,5-DOPA dioxygenase extradiol [Comamonas aquatica]|uniref:4,5-DOPA-extradiol-dioxygenase n=1 Tax=Comamonas aquatica TaxID=225991 RepID=UPI0034D50E53
MTRTQTLGTAVVQAGLTELKPSARMPVLFVGHGSPMNAIGDNAYRRSWQQLGQQLLARAERPQLVLCISAHWITQGQGAWLTGMAQPKTIHDFGGFPDELFAQQYPAPGAPAVAQQLAHSLQMPQNQQALRVDVGEWGLDHGTWSVLKPMFPQADIPVIQLSIDYSRPPAEHFAIGQQLRALRERGVLIVGSGNVVHNLRATRPTPSPLQAYDWAIEFDRMVSERVGRGDLAGLRDFQQLGAVAQMAHPTYDHYLPLLYAAGAVDPKEAVQFFNADFQRAAISMRSMLWGA